MVTATVQGNYPRGNVGGSHVPSGQASSASASSISGAAAGVARTSAESLTCLSSYLLTGCCESGRGKRDANFLAISKKVATMLSSWWAYLIAPCRAACVFAAHTILAAFIYFCVWLLEQFIHLFSASEPMLWNNVPAHYVFDGGEFFIVIGVAVHGLRDIWIALESGTPRVEALLSKTSDGSK
jgi:hypothetical protein